MSGDSTLRASAPTRLDFAGGWTDVAPFATRERGLVVNAAIELRAFAELTLQRKRYFLQSVDLDQTMELSHEELGSYGQLELLKAAVRRSGLPPCGLRTWCEAPPGSGLGSSGALDVAMVAVLDRARGIERPPEGLAEEGYQLEAVEAGFPGGKQDQYAAALGGFLRLTFDHGESRAERLDLDPGFLTALAAHTVICYTGMTRVSSRTIERVMDAYARGKRGVVAALHALADSAEAMTEALRASDLPRVGALLSANWERQLELDRDMRTEAMGRLEQAMSHARVLGGKAAGAGAGGCMFFLASHPAQALEAARSTGSRVIPCRWSPEGARVECP
jgi:D-glycero-alpha-D-manno-heptose-7-phosphate kinase